VNGENEIFDVLQKQITDLNNKIDFVVKQKKEEDEKKNEEQKEVKMFQKFVKLLKDAGFITKSETVEELKQIGFITKADVASLGPYKLDTPSREQDTPQKVITGQVDKPKDEEEEEEKKAMGEDPKKDEKVEAKQNLEDKKKDDDMYPEYEEERKALKDEIAQLRKEVEEAKRGTTLVQKQFSELGWKPVSAVQPTATAPETVIAKSVAGAISEEEKIQKLMKLSYSERAILQAKVARGEVIL